MLACQMEPVLNYLRVAVGSNPYRSPSVRASGTSQLEALAKGLLDLNRGLIARLPTALVRHASRLAMLIL